MKTFDQWINSSTDEVKRLPDMGKKLSYAMYKQRIIHSFDKDDCPDSIENENNKSEFRSNLIGFNVK